MQQTNIDQAYMRRCLQLAACGRNLSRPNPMVGAVIVAHGRIIGEGYHVQCGQSHAEVNAFASVQPQDEPLLKEATLYVSLEPCSHYGKTPPCADLIIRKGVKRVVVGCIDPFHKVQGNGIDKLRKAGIQVTCGVLEQECQWLNRRFFTFHQLQRPYIILKYAQTQDGFLDDHGQPINISTPLTRMLLHRLRATEDAILVGNITEQREHPQLNVRHWAGPAPQKFVLSHQHPIPEILQTCYQQQLQSLIVEGGLQTLQSFIKLNLWDEIRVETAPLKVGQGTQTPQLPDNRQIISTQTYGQNTITRYRKTEENITT